MNDSRVRKDIQNAPKFVSETTVYSSNQEHFTISHVLKSRGLLSLQDFVKCHAIHGIEIIWKYDFIDLKEK